MKKLALLAVLISLIFPWSVLAQGEYQADLSKPDIYQFPFISSYLNIHTPDGSFIHGLDDESVFILEDGKILDLTAIQEIRIGLQVSVVINAGPGFAGRNTKGISRYDYLHQYLEAWAQDQKEIGIDDLSLITSSGVNQSHLTNSQAWLTALATYQPDLKQSVPSLDALGIAIQNAQDTQVSQPIHKAIFYIAPLPGDEMTETIRDDLIARANDADVHVFVWMLASRGDFDAPTSGYLRSLAEQTGGQFFAFSGNEPFPEAQTLLEPLRYLYQVSYLSKIQVGGKHNLAVRVNLQEDTVTTAPVTFELDLQPPVPIFVGLPSSIRRTAPDKSKEPLKELSPSNLLVEFMVEYPDNLHRELSGSRLLVDGQEIGKNTAPPYTRFQWDISGYTTSSRHIVQIEIIDSLGITASSNTLPVQIDVIIPEKTNWQDFVGGNGLYLLLIGVFLLGISATYIFFRFKRGTIQVTNIKPGPQAIHSSERALLEDVSSTSMDMTPGWRASLVLVNEKLEIIGEPPIRLGDKPVTWGKNRELVSIWVEDAALDEIHCKIWLAENQRYFLADNHSGSGTWLNYTEVPTEGKQLMHGDIIQIGDLLYRYEETTPQETKKIDVMIYNNNQ